MPQSLHVLRKGEGKPGEVYFPLEIKTYTPPTPKESQVVVKMHSVALNHRDLFIRQLLYPAVDFSVPMCADGCGVVTSTGSSEEAKKWQGKRVIINPGIGWKSDPRGPEDPKGYAILGATKLNKNGTAVTEYVSEIDELEPAPEHLDDHQAASLPLAGLTAFRATHVKAREAMSEGKNVLVTGIGGGVAIMAMLFAVGAGANVYVSSGNKEKIEKAKKMGAKGGVSYKDKDWVNQLRGLLGKGQMLDAVIDGAGGEIVGAGAKLLRAGGVISVYGMTTGPKMPFLMNAVLKNIEVRGSTMGSREDFKKMVQFVNEKKLTPVVSKVAYGLDNLQEIETLFEDMKNGSQFGKLVIQIEGKGGNSKL